MISLLQSKCINALGAESHQSEHHSCIIDFMCLWLLKFTPSESSKGHAIAIFLNLVSLVLRNKYFWSYFLLQ